MKLSFIFPGKLRRRRRRFERRIAARKTVSSRPLFLPDFQWERRRGKSRLTSEGAPGHSPSRDFGGQSPVAYFSSQEDRSELRNFVSIESEQGDGPKKLRIRVQKW